MRSLQSETEDKVPNCYTESLCCLSRKPRYVTTNGQNKAFCDTFSSNQTISDYCDAAYESDSRLEPNSTSRTKPNHVVFECDFKKQVKEALQRVVGIIDKVKSVEVNKIRSINDTDYCKISTNDGNELLDNYSYKYNDTMKSAMQTIKNDKLNTKNKNPPPCFVIEYLIQVIVVN